jgi:PBSX family phage terminase large subunit
MIEDIVNINLTDCIGPAYYEMFHDIEARKHSTYWLKGGRGSLKGSFAYLYTILDLTRDAENGIMTHAVGMRKVKETIRDSIFTNLLWAINKLGLSDLWDFTVNPMKIWHVNNGNTILFRGCANQKDFEKIKSLKFEKGYCKIAIFEELTEFAGMDEVDSIIQSLFRGGNEAITFMMYNPPPSKKNWTNEQCKLLENLIREGVDVDTYIHKSTYLQAPKEWLGVPFIKKAKQIKLLNPKKYRHMYLGEETGEGLEIFPEYDPRTRDGVLVLREISDDEIEKFTKIDRGLDFGYSHATAYGEIFYDSKNMDVYVFDEVYKYKANNDMLVRAIKPKSQVKLIRGDSEDPRTINELNIAGLNIIGVKKGKDSKPHGIKWLQDRARIIIDPKRCPMISSDFSSYEFKKDKEGKIIYEYPDEPDGCACIRYGLEPYILNDSWETWK